MYYTLKYSIFFIVVMLLQIFLFNNLMLSIYISPLVYIAFILLLPLETPRVLVLFLGLITGIVADLSMGTVGVNTAATLLTAYSRGFLLDLILGKEIVKDGGVICKERVGLGKLLRFITLATLIHCTCFFSLETMQWDYYLYTLIRIVISSIFTIFFVFILSFLMSNKPSLRI